MDSAQEDYDRTVALFGDLARYAQKTGADLHFVDLVGRSLVCSLPERRPGDVQRDGDTGPGSQPTDFG
ncbi:hypothetical protein ACH41H_10285 [Streptomyces sp. NPDC020800]|uniref:hypothetical protein n=1 Tax=Streptomyces sp. NPDC020800 TaxID=3365092 RepID=UPI003791CCC3